MNRAHVACLLVVVAMLSGVASAQHTRTVNQNLTIALTPAAEITGATADVTLNRATPFAAYTGTTTVSFKLRNTVAGGHITVQGSAFSPAGGPSMAGGDLKFTCATTLPGATCNVANVAVPFGSSTNVITSFAASTATGASPATVDLNLSLVNKATYQANPAPYTATLTFTISAT